MFWEGHVLRLCSWLQPGIVFAEEWRHLKKPQEDPRRAQGVLLEGHVRKQCSWLQPGVLFADE